MTQKFRFHFLVHNSVLTGGVIVKNQDFDVLMILGYVRAEELCCQKLPEIVAEHPGIFTPLDPSVTWMTFCCCTFTWQTDGEGMKGSVFFSRAHVFRCMEIDAKVNEFYLWHGTHIRAALSIAREAKGLCPKWIVRCALWHQWMKEDDFMDVYFFGCCWDVN